MATPLPLSPAQDHRVPIVPSAAPHGREVNSSVAPQLLRHGALGVQMLWSPFIHSKDRFLTLLHDPRQARRSR